MAEFSEEPVQAAVVRLLQGLVADAEVEASRDAIGYTLQVSYTESAKEVRTLHGFLTDPASALRAAETWEAELNQGDEDLPPANLYKVTVIPIQRIYE